MNGLAGCWSGSEQIFGFDLDSGQDRTEQNRPGGSGALFFSLYPVRQCCTPSPPTVDTTREDTRTHSTLRYVPMTVPTVPSLSQSRSKSQSNKSQDDPGLQGPGCPHRLTPTFTYSGRAGSFFDRPQWFLLFLPPYPPFPSHTPAHFFSTSTTTDLSDYSFSLLLPYPSPNLVFVTTGFSSTSPLSLFGHVLLSSSPTPSSFPSRTTTHHLGLLLRTSPFRVSADPQT